MRTRSWEWLCRRIVGLVSRPQGTLLLGHDAEGFAVTVPVYVNRLQVALANKRR